MPQSPPRLRPGEGPGHRELQGLWLLRVPGTPPQGPTAKGSQYGAAFQVSGANRGVPHACLQDPSIVDVAIAALDGMKLGDKTLTVRRATAR